MASRKIELEPTETPEYGDFYAADTLNPALEALYEDMGIADGDAMVHVAKIDTDGRGVESQLGKYTPDEYDLESIARKFGSGTYRVRVYVRIETGQRVVKINKTLRWLLSKEDELRLANLGSPQAQPAPSISAEDVARIVASTLRDAMPRVEPVNPMAAMREMAEVMKLISPAVAVAAPATDTFGMMRNMIDLMKMMKGDEPSAPMGESAGTSDVLLAMINKFGPMFAGVMAQQGAQQAQMMPQQMHALGAPQPLQNPLPAQIPEQPVEQPTDDEVNLQLKMGLMFLVNGCEKGGSAESYAEMVIDNVPADELKMLLDAPNVLDVLAKTEPSVARHAEWFTLLFNEVRAILAPEADEPAVPVSVDAVQKTV